MELEPEEELKQFMQIYKSKMETQTRFTDSKIECSYLMYLVIK